MQKKSPTTQKREVELNHYSIWRQIATNYPQIAIHVFAVYVIAQLTYMELPQQVKDLYRKIIPQVVQYINFTSNF